MLTTALDFISHLAANLPALQLGVLTYIAMMVTILFICRNRN